MNRRSFIVTSAAFVGGSALIPLGCSTPAPELTTALTLRPGIQLYTLRDALADDFEGTLAQVAEIGYTEVETHSYFGRTPAEVRSILDGLGLRAPSAHYGVQPLRDELASVIDAALAIGHEYVICPHPGDLPHETLDDYRAMGEFFDGIGARFRENGINFGYHNHEFELQPIDGQIPLFALLDNADPQNVVLELDLFWAVEAGYDPVDVIERYPGRIHAYHVKDRTQEGEMTDVGQGVIDFGRIFGHNVEAGVRHTFVEHDRPTDALQSAQTSYRALVSLIS